MLFRSLIKDEGTKFEELDLIARINQENGRQFLKIVKEEEEEHAKISL